VRESERERERARERESERESERERENMKKTRDMSMCSAIACGTMERWGAGVETQKNVRDTVSDRETERERAREICIHIYIYICHSLRIEARTFRGL